MSDINDSSTDLRQSTGIDPSDSKGNDSSVNNPEHEKSSDFEKEVEKPSKSQPIGKKQSPCAKTICSIYSLLIKIRTVIRKLSAIASKHMDPTLSTIGYSSLLLSAILKKLPNTSLGGNFRSLYSMISDFRMFLRLWGTLSVAEWTCDTLVDPGTSDPVLKICTYIQAIAGTLYQVLEDIAYLSSKKVIPLSAKKEGKIWIVSCYFWALHVQLELIKIFRRKLAGEKNLLTPFIVNLAWLPLTVHWSTESGFLKDHHVGLFGVIANTPRIIPMWIKGLNEY